MMQSSRSVDISYSSCDLRPTVSMKLISPLLPRKSGPIKLISSISSRQQSMVNATETRGYESFKQNNIKIGSLRRKPVFVKISPLRLQSVVDPKSSPIVMNKIKEPKNIIALSEIEISDITPEIILSNEKKPQMMEIFSKNFIKKNSSLSKDINQFIPQDLNIIISAKKTILGHIHHKKHLIKFSSITSTQLETGENPSQMVPPRPKSALVGSFNIDAQNSKQPVKSILSVNRKFQFPDSKNNSKRIESRRQDQPSKTSRKRVSFNETPEIRPIKSKW